VSIAANSQHADRNEVKAWVPFSVVTEEVPEKKKKVKLI
jgi:hypothetical protein